MMGRASNWNKTPTFQTLSAYITRDSCVPNNGDKNSLQNLRVLFCTDVTDHPRRLRDKAVCIWS
jgi:hypothetical protein